MLNTTKGVICKIIDDADMPTDDFGFRADLVIDPASIFARMNVGQIYEQAINRTSEFIRRSIQQVYATTSNDAWRILIEYYEDVNPNYAKLIVDTKKTQAKIDEHLKEVIRGGIFLHIPPGLETANLDLIRKLKTKYQIPLSPVTFTQRDEDKNIIGTFRTKKNVCIGSKYLYLLCKIPDPSSPGVAHTNQYNTPIKSPPSDKLRYPIRRAPSRLGEDEGRISLMDIKDPKEIVRLMCLQANSQKGVDMLIEEILRNPHPTRINRIPISNEELLNSNTIVLMFRHMMATIGLGSSELGPHPIKEHVSMKDILNE